MAKKRTNSFYYSDSKIMFDGKFYRETLPDGCLYSHTRKRVTPTKIKPSDLPEYYMEVSLWSTNGYVRLKDVKQIIYCPNYVFNHLYKDDIMYITYEGSEDMQVVPTRFGETVEGADIISGSQNFHVIIDNVEKYSNIDVSDIKAEMAHKIEWYGDGNPKPDRIRHHQFISSKPKG